MKNVIQRIRLLPDCEVIPSKGLPNLKRQLPNDLVEFYGLCGGVRLFQGMNYCIEVVGPNEFVLANPVIVGDLIPDDISSNWYIVARSGSDQYITIDLAEERIGRCYDSFYDVHGIVGSCPVIARSFSELLANLVEGKGEYWYWLKSDFTSLGDAYD